MLDAISSTTTRYTCNIVNKTVLLQKRNETFELQKSIIVL